MHQDAFHVCNETSELAKRSQDFKIADRNWNFKVQNYDLLTIMPAWMLNNNPKDILPT